MHKMSIYFLLRVKPGFILSRFPIEFSSKNHLNKNYCHDHNFEKQPDKSGNIDSANFITMGPNGSSLCVPPVQDFPHF